MLGTGLLKPNISVIVGQLYAQKDVRRDAAFSLFYMGINLGAFLGPLITGYLAQDERFRAIIDGWGMDPNSGWHWGFGAAGVGMTLGLMQYVLGGRQLGTAGIEPAPPKSPAHAARTRQQAMIRLGRRIAPARAVRVRHGHRHAAIHARADHGAYTLRAFGITLGFFGWLFLRRRLDAAERKRLYLIGVFFIAAAFFWSVFEQAGSTLNLFADRSTRTSLPGYGSSRAVGGSR